MSAITTAVRKKESLEAVHFLTNNEVGSPHMDDIVNWANRGRDARSNVGAWHNGTDIFVTTAAGVCQAVPGDWVIRGRAGFEVLNNDDFMSTYEAA